MLSKTTTYLAASVGGVLLLVMLLLHRHDGYRTCIRCYSHRKHTSFSVGLVEARIPVSPEINEIDHSHIHQNFYGKKHIHNWQFGAEEITGILGTTYLCGTTPGNHFVEFYEMSPKFRAWIDERRSSGDLSRKKLMNMIQHNPYPDTKTEGWKTQKNRINQLLENFDERTRRNTESQKK